MERAIPEGRMSRKAEAKVWQKDLNVRWTRNDGRNYYGYKQHMKVSLKTKLSESFAVTDAAVSESQCLEQLMDGRRYGVLYWQTWVTTSAAWVCSESLQQ